MQVTCQSNATSSSISFLVRKSVANDSWLVLSWAEGLLEHGNEVALSVAIVVFAQIHGLVQLDGLWHSGINQLLNAAKSCDFHHLCYILRRGTIVAESKPAISAAQLVVGSKQQQAVQSAPIHAAAPESALMRLTACRLARDAA